jgi:hypothetical protein
MPGTQCPVPEKQCPHFNLPDFINETWTSLVSPSFIYIKPGPGCQGHVSLFLTFHKQNTFRLMFLFPKDSHSMFPQNPSERHGALAISDLVRILLSHNNLVRLWLMAPNISPFLVF